MPDCPSGIMYSGRPSICWGPVLFLLSCGGLVSRLFFYNAAGQLLTVGRYDVIAGLHGRIERIKTASGLFHGMVDNGLKTAEHIVCILDGTLTDAVGVLHCLIHD